MLIDNKHPVGIDRFYYAKTVPQRGIAIAKISTTETTTADMVNILNTSYLAGNLNIWIYDEGSSGPPTFEAGDYNVSVTISGSSIYILDNQFFEITNYFDADNNPLFYRHNFVSNGQVLTVGTATIIDFNGKVISTIPAGSAGMTYFYHSLDGQPYHVRYLNSNTGVTENVILQYKPAIENSNVVGPNTYILEGNTLTLSGSGNFSIRFTQSTGFQVLAPYNTPSYLPWFPRIRFPIGTPPYDYYVQNFNPARPYLLGYWVEGKVIADQNQEFPNVVEFDRYNIFTGGTNFYPDILIFDQYSNFKYALEGSASGNGEYLGSLYNWEGLQISGMDPYKARLQVLKNLDSTDIVYGFYSYNEPDLLFTSLDVNPVTNPIIKNNIVYFYQRSGTGGTSVDTLFYQIFNSSGPILTATNDQTPPTWTFSSGGWTPSSGVVFGTLTVGTGYNASDFTITDVRVRGGGLNSSSQNIPIANNFWDIGYLDGKPYPIGGVTVIYLPISVQDKLSKNDINRLILNILPEGVYLCIRYFDQNGNESV